jgi:ribulose-phosphate 3-epimerase
MSIQIAPSILSADFGNLERDIQKVRSGDLLHIDVMDYHFVPNLTFGGDVVGRLIEVSPIPADVHLMIDNADRWAVNYAKMGAYSVTFHWGAVYDPVELARRLHDAQAKVCIAIKPDEPIEPILNIVNNFDMVLIMTVEPGFGAQELIPRTLEKVQTLRKFVDDNFLTLDIEVDGGINSQTIGSAVRAGANVIVAGSDIFKARVPQAQIKKLRELAQTS